MFVHPMCPCSRASVEELARVMSSTAPRIAVRVVATRPTEAPESWEDSALLGAIRALPDVELVFDRTGAESRVFGAQTSGHVVLFDETGRRLFTGGITSARGHSGDNAGADAIVSLIGGQLKTGPVQTAVYGCPLPQKP
jgi:hypothetical protein